MFKMTMEDFWRAEGTWKGVYLRHFSCRRSSSFGKIVDFFDIQRPLLLSYARFSLVYFHLAEEWFGYVGDLKQKQSDVFWEISSRRGRTTRSKPFCKPDRIADLLKNKTTRISIPQCHSSTRFPTTYHGRKVEHFDFGIIAFSRTEVIGTQDRRNCDFRQDSDLRYIHEPNPVWR